jgi:hypothetical protein
VARKWLILLIAILVPGGLFALAAALIASFLGTRFPQLSRRLHLTARRLNAAPAEPAAPLQHA